MPRPGTSSTEASWWRRPCIMAAGCHETTAGRRSCQSGSPGDRNRIENGSKSARVCACGRCALPLVAAYLESAYSWPASSLAFGPASRCMGEAAAPVPLWRVKAYYFVTLSKSTKTICKTYEVFIRVSWKMMMPAAAKASFCFFASYERYLTLYFEADGFPAAEIGFMPLGRVFSAVNV